MIFHEDNSGMFKVIWLGVPPTQPRNNIGVGKKCEIQKDFICAHEWIISLPLGHVEKKENSINLKGKFWVREICFSLSPRILSWPERKTTQYYLRVFFMID